MDFRRYGHRADTHINRTSTTTKESPSRGGVTVTQLTLSCAECGSDVAIANLRASDTDATAVLQTRCPACHEEGTAEVRSTNVGVALEGAVSSRASAATAKSGCSLSAGSDDTGDEGDVSRVSHKDSAARETDAAGGESTVEIPTNQHSESQSEHDTAPEDESTSEPESESHESDDADYETVLDELDAVRGAGVKNLRDRSEVEGVARAVGHEALLMFLQNADDTEYRTAVQKATEPRD
jgi:hypothetical protein